MLLGSIVDQDIEATEIAHRQLDGLAAEGLVAHIAGDGEAAPAFLFHLTLGLLSVLMLVQVDDGDVGAFLGEEDRDRPADPAVTTRDQRHAPIKLAAAAIVLILSAWLRGHLRFKPRLPVLVLGWLLLLTRSL